MNINHENCENCENCNNTDWSGRRVTVIGAGVSGTALACLARRLGAEVFVSEERDSVNPDTARALRESGCVWETGGHSSRAFEADVLLLSSGISPNAPCVAEAKRRGLPVTGELDVVVPLLLGKIVGVTGSNGKSTLTALTGHILRKAGYKTAVGGNIGEAAALFTEDRFDFIVLELSSFQLHWAHELKSAVGIVTNLAPDHIDWHGSYGAYAAAKAKILSLQDAAGWGIVQDRDCAVLKIKPERTVVLSWTEKQENAAAGHIFMGRDEAVLRFEGGEQPLFRYADNPLPGKHNAENAAMALAAARLLGASAAGGKACLDGFRPLPHRCEIAGTVDGVTYIDDSKATNVASAVTAMTSIEGRKTVILGGQGKGEDYSLLAETALRHAASVVLLGAEKGPIGDALQKVGHTDVHEVADMEEAVLTARGLSRPGMVVLLSPACTSWDMYPNYKKRGEHFCALVRGLPTGASRE